jgi:hypothetical protein
MISTTTTVLTTAIVLRIATSRMTTTSTRSMIQAPSTSTSLGHRTPWNRWHLVLESGQREIKPRIALTIGIQVHWSRIHRGLCHLDWLRNCDGGIRAPSRIEAPVADSIVRIERLVRSIWVEGGELLLWYYRIGRACSGVRGSSFVVVVVCAAVTWYATVLVATRVRDSGWVHMEALVLVFVNVVKTRNVTASTAAMEERGSSGIQVKCLLL